MKILETIVQAKRIEVEKRSHQTSIQELQESIYYKRKCLSLRESILKRSGIIAEFKRQSPSKGRINQNANAGLVTSGYENAGVSGISVLTDQQFFGAFKEDFEEVRKVVNIPILRKDFIIDSYQIHESKAMGADVILLIARILSPDLVREFTEIAHGLGMEVLLETHSQEEIESHYFESIDLIGINNRDLNTFEVNFERSIQLASKLPKSVLKIAESGIGSEEDILFLKENGYQGFLIGESFMKSDNPALKCADFIKNLNLVSHEN